MSRARARVGLREMRRGGVSSARSLVHGGSEEGGADREGPRRREREKGRVGQRLGVWQNEPARHRGKMGARGGGGSKWHRQVCPTRLGEGEGKRAGAETATDRWRPPVRQRRRAALLDQAGLARLLCLFLFL
jgi:hypothetical protein